MLGTVKVSVDSDNRTLVAEGWGEKGQTVTLRIPDTSVVVGTTTVPDNGQWSLQVVGLRDIPCRLDVEIGEVRGETNVKGVCDDEPAPHDLTIFEVDWEAGDGKLKGRASPEAVVRLSDADTGNALGQVSAYDEGKWKLKRELETVPVASPPAAAARL